MKITLEQNKGEDKVAIPYFARIEIVTATVDADSVFTVPVHLTKVNARSVYDVEVCGFRLDTEDVAALPKVTERLVQGLINRARLPSYVFIARHAGGIYPVYTIDNEVMATTPGGPVFRHVELAKVREYLGDYLHNSGLLGVPGLDDKLHVRGVDLHTLGLRRPVFYLKKRVPGQVDFWAPVFAAGDGRSVYTYAASARRQAPLDFGQEVLQLRDLVAQALQADGRLHESYDLRPDRLFPDTWEALKTTLKPRGSTTVNGKEIYLYENGRCWLGLELRAPEARYSLFLGESAPDVAARALDDLTRRQIGVDPLLTAVTA